MSLLTVQPAGSSKPLHRPTGFGVGMVVTVVGIVVVVVVMVVVTSQVSQSTLHWNAMNEVTALVQKSLVYNLHSYG
jgi:hypothetical protein